MLDRAAITADARRLVKPRGRILLPREHAVASRFAVGVRPLGAGRELLLLAGPANQSAVSIGYLAGCLSGCLSLPEAPGERCSKPKCVRAIGDEPKRSLPSAGSGRLPRVYPGTDECRPLTRPLRSWPGSGACRRRSRGAWRCDRPAVAAE